MCGVKTVTPQELLSSSARRWCCHGVSGTLLLLLSGCPRHKGRVGASPCLGGARAMTEATSSSTVKEGQARYSEFGARAILTLWVHTCSEQHTCDRAAYQRPEPAIPKTSTPSLCAPRAEEAASTQMPLTFTMSSPPPLKTDPSPLSLTQSPALGPSPPPGLCLEAEIQVPDRAGWANSGHEREISQGPHHRILGAAPPPPNLLTCCTGACNGRGDRTQHLWNSQ